MSAKPKNVTFTLPPELIEKYKSYVKQDIIPSVNAGVKEALESYSAKLDKDLLLKEMTRASKDRLFMKDLEDNMKLFEPVDHEAAKGDSEW